MTKSKIGIMGAGSIGCFLGANLLKAGVPTMMIGRENLKNEIKETGLKITDLNGREFHIPAEKVNFSSDMNDLQDCDIIFICVKSGDTETIAKELKDVLKPEAIVLSFQNGVRNADILKNTLVKQTVLAGMVPYNVVKTGLAAFHNGTSGELIVEQKDNISDKVLEILHKAGLSAFAHTNMKGILWGKLIFNLNNAVNALAGIPLREELSNYKFRKVVSLAAKEGLNVLKKSGIKTQRLGKMIPHIVPFVMSLPDFLFFSIASKMVKIDPKARSSMWEDLEKGRKTEIEFLNGEIVRLGEQVNYSTPVNTCIRALIKEAEAKKSGSPQLSAEDLWLKIISFK